jgi:hypothetical protein
VSCSPYAAVDATTNRQDHATKCLIYALLP